MAADNAEFSPGRKKSGQVRDIGLLGACLFGIHCISLSSSGFIPFSWVASVWPGASITWVLVIAAVFCLVHGLSYAIIGGTVPLAGADYVFASRVVHPALAFAASWTLVVFSGVVAGGLAAWIPQSAIPALARPIAIIFGDDRFNLMADFAVTPLGSFTIGGAVLVLAAVSIITGNMNIQRVLLIGFVLGVLAWIVIYISLLLARGPSDFQVAWDRFMGASSSYGKFTARVALAQKAGMDLNNSTFNMTLAGLIMGFWIFYGYYIPTFFSEEVRHPAKTLAWASSIAILVSLFVFVLGAILLERLVDITWIGAEGYIFNNPEKIAMVTGGEKVLAMPWITFYAAILLPNAFFIYFVAVAWVFTLFNLVQTYFYYSSRIVLSWALDGVMLEAVE